MCKDMGERLELVRGYLYDTRKKNENTHGETVASLREPEIFYDKFREGSVSEPGGMMRTRERHVSLKYVVLATVFQDFHFAV